MNSSARVLVPVVSAGQAARADPTGRRQKKYSKSMTSTKTANSMKVNAPLCTKISRKEKSSRPRIREVQAASRLPPTRHRSNNLIARDNQSAHNSSCGTFHSQNRSSRRQSVRLESQGGRARHSVRAAPGIATLRMHFQSHRDCVLQPKGCELASYPGLA